MSVFLTDAAQQEFDAEVKHAYQGAQMLAGGYRHRRNVVGSTANFRKMGKGIANQKPTQADVVPMGVTHALVPCTLANWVAPEYTDIFDQAEVNFDEKMELAKTIAMAIGRREDQIIIEALKLSANLAAVDTDVGGSASGFNLAKMLRLSQKMTAAGVPRSGRHLLVNARALEQALNIATFSSVDYNGLRALVQGDINSYGGFTWHVIDDRNGTGEESGLNIVSGAIRQGWAWHEEAVGMATGIEFRTEINYVPQKTSWLCNGLFKGGAVIIDAAGVYGVQYTET